MNLFYIIKTLPFLILFLLLGCGENEPTQEATPKSHLWINSHSKSLRLAKESSKNILMSFTGSDWCPPCKILDKNILSKKAFLNYAQEKLILLEIDFPSKKQQSEDLMLQNKRLANQYQTKGFPTLILTNSKGAEKARFNYFNSGSGLALKQTSKAGAPINRKKNSYSTPSEFIQYLKTFNP